MQKPQKPETLWIIFTDCTDPGKEAEFNNWYNKVHVPDMLAAAGGKITRVRRYRNIKKLPGIPEYMAVYSIETDDPKKLAKKVESESTKWQYPDSFKFQWGAIFNLAAEL